MRFVSLSCFNMNLCQKCWSLVDSIFHLMETSFLLSLQQKRNPIAWCTMFDVKDGVSWMMVCAQIMLCLQAKELNFFLIRLQNLFQTVSGLDPRLLVGLSQKWLPSSHSPRGKICAVLKTLLISQQYLPFQPMNPVSFVTGISKFNRQFLALHDSVTDLICCLSRVTSQSQ